jgi:Tripartite tricarboxylate transporter TctB family
MSTLRLAFCLLAIAVLAIWQVMVIPSSPMYAVVGATLVPAVVVALYTICSALYALTVVRKTAVDAATDSEEAALPGAASRSVHFILGALLFVLTIKWLGFIAAATLAGMGIARAFDAPLSTKSFLICLFIAITFWAVFDLTLGVDLGPLIPLLTKIG